MAGDYPKQGGRKEVLGMRPYANTEPGGDLNSIKIPTLGSVPPARTADIFKPVAKRMSSVRANLTVALASLAIGAAGATSYQCSKTDKPEKDESSLQAASASKVPESAVPTATTESEKTAATDILERTAKETEKAKTDVETDSGEPITGERMAEALRTFHCYPTPEDFNKPAYAENKYMKAIKLVKMPIAPYPGSDQTGIKYEEGNADPYGRDADNGSYIYEWRPMNSGNGNFTRVDNAETVIAVKLQDPEYAEMLRYEGLWQPVATYTDKANDIVILLFNNCTVQVTDPKFDEKTREKKRLNYPKHGGATSIIMGPSAKPKDVKAIYMLRIYPCVQ
jgi:hypothetical protein